MLPEDELGELRTRFGSFAAETRGRSPLYSHLSEVAAQDESLAGLLRAAPPRQRRPNLLFAAIHDLLLAGNEHPLASYYPSVGGEQRPDDEAFGALRDFVDVFRDEIDQRLRTRSTQTNEPGRCAALLPALCRLAARTSRPIALVELGASAGLLLHLDRYHYRYGDVVVGPPSSPVLIEPDRHGSELPPLDVPRISARTGIDLDPASPHDPGDVRWIKACVWPENVDRIERLDSAFQIAKSYDDVELIEGDFVTQLRPAVRNASRDHFVCVLHSAAFAYLDDQDRTATERQLEELGAQGDLARICFEGPFIKPFASMNQRAATTPPAEEEYFLLGLSIWSGGVRHDELLARAQPHGHWLTWLAAGDGT